MLAQGTLASIAQRAYMNSKGIFNADQIISVCHAPKHPLYWRACVAAYLFGDRIVLGGSLFDCVSRLMSCLMYICLLLMVQQHRVSNAYDVSIVWRVGITSEHAKYNCL